MANYTVTTQFGISVLFMLILIHRGCCENAICDVNHCKSLFSTVFKDFLKKGTQRLCRSSDHTIQCVDKCLLTFFPDFDFINPNTSILSEVCSYDFQNDLNENWNCISGHFHRLLTCIAKFGSMIPIHNTSENVKVLSCKKFVQALDCPYKILLDCDGNVMEIVSKLLSKVFSVSMNSACYAIALNDVDDLLVTYNLNDSYSSTSACLDKLPNVAGNCFTQYLKDFDANDLYHCSNTCENLGETSCLPSSLMDDFYIPVLSYGKHSCKKDSTVENKLQMEEPSKVSTISYDLDMSSDVYPQVSTANYKYENDGNVRFDEAKRSNVLSLDVNGTETSTFNYKLNTKEIDSEKVLSTIHPSNNFSSRTSVASSVVPPEINLSSGFATDNDASENNISCRLEFYLHYLILNLIFVFIFL